MEETRIYRTLYKMLFGNGGPLYGEEVIEQDLEMGNDVYDTVNGTLFSSLVHWYFELGTVDSFWNESTVASAKRYINVLFCRYIYPKYKDMAVAYGETQQEVDRASYNFLIHLMNRIRASYDEYRKLIDLYDSIKDNLLDEIKSQTKFNDTPQTTTTAGVTSYDDTYNTNVSTTYNDGASKIVRLAEVETYIKDYYTKWANYVCRGLFIYE